MKKLLYHLSVVTIACSALVSCQETLKEDAGIPQNDPDGLQLTVLASNPSVNEGVIVGTRSEITDADKVTDVNFFVFSSDTGEFVSSSYHAKNSGISAAELFIHNGYTFTDKFDVYILANMGDVHDDQYLTDLQSINDFTYCFDPEFSSFKTKGFPMSSVYKDFCPITDIPAGSTLLADRLVAELHIKFTQSANNHNGYEIVSGFIGNLTRIAQPFADDAYACPGTSNTYTEKFEGHTFDNKLVNDEVTVYALENVHGMTPLKDNFKNKQSLTDQEKCKENLLEDYQNNRITYLDITCNVTYANSGETHPNVRYRYYFGNDNKDFSVYRNTVSEVTINFDNIEVTNEGWREEDGEKYYRPSIDNISVKYSGHHFSNTEIEGNITNSGFEGDIIITGQDQLSFDIDVDITSQTNSTITYNNNYHTQQDWNWTLKVYDPADLSTPLATLTEGQSKSITNPNSTNKTTITNNITNLGYLEINDSFYYILTCDFGTTESFINSTTDLSATIQINIVPVADAIIDKKYEIINSTLNHKTEGGYTVYYVQLNVGLYDYNTSELLNTYTINVYEEGPFNINGNVLGNMKFNIAHNGTMEGCGEPKFAIGQTEYNEQSLTYTIEDEIQINITHEIEVTSCSLEYDYLALPTGYYFYLGYPLGLGTPYCFLTRNYSYYFKINYGIKVYKNGTYVGTDSRYIKVKQFKEKDRQFKDVKLYNKVIARIAVFRKPDLITRIKYMNITTIDYTPILATDLDGHNLTLFEDPGDGKSIFYEKDIYAFDVILFPSYQTYSHH